MHLQTKAPRRFNLTATVFSHGWVYLPPFSWEQDCLRTRLWIQDQSLPIAITQSSKDRQTLRISVEIPSEISGRQVGSSVTQAIRWMLRLDENLASATPLLAGDPQIASALRQGAGRFLRAPSIWEEAVRILCTTNINWTGTIAMMTGLVAMGRGSFPTPEQVLAASPQGFEQARLGYRLPYLVELAQRFSEPDTPEQWRHQPVSRLDALQELKPWRGFGPYATAHMLVQLGHYEQIPIDSEVRAFHPGVSDPEIRMLYAPYAPYDFLAYKLRRIAMGKNWIGQDVGQAKGE